MLMCENLVFIVPFLYSGMISLELVSSFCRVAGYYKKLNSLAASIQYTTFTLTRFFYVLMMPVIGYIVDIGVSRSTYIVMIVACYFVTSVFSFFVYLFRYKVIFFYMSLLEVYKSGGSLLMSFVSGIKASDVNEIKLEKIDGTDWKDFTLACLIYFIHAIGVFLAFYVGLLFPDNRVMITQMSGVVNALGTLLLTMKLDPQLSRKIENREGFVRSFYSIFMARFFVFLVLAPCFFIGLYFL